MAEISSTATSATPAPTGEVSENKEIAKRQLSPMTPERFCTEKLCPLVQKNTDDAKKTPLFADDTNKTREKGLRAKIIELAGTPEKDAALKAISEKAFPKSTADLMLKVVRRVTKPALGILISDDTMYPVVNSDRTDAEGKIILDKYLNGGDLKRSEALAAATVLNVLMPEAKADQAFQKLIANVDASKAKEAIHNVTGNIIAEQSYGLLLAQKSGVFVPAKETHSDTLFNIEGLVSRGQFKVLHTETTVPTADLKDLFAGGKIKEKSNLTRPDMDVDKKSIV